MTLPRKTSWRRSGPVSPIVSILLPRAATRKSRIIFLQIRAARQGRMTSDGYAWPFIAAAHSISYLRLAGRSTGASRSGGGLSSTLGYSPHPPRSSSAIPSPSRGGMKKPCSIASPGEPAKACKRARCAQVERSAVAHQSRGLAGHRAAASVAQDGQPLGAPLMRRYFNAHAAAPYLCSRSSGPCGRTAGLTRASQPRRQRVRTPDAGPLACARVRRTGFRPPSYARTSGAATPIPRSRRSAARVLMDEGWAESKRGGEGGDKW